MHIKTARKVIYLLWAIFLVIFLMITTGCNIDTAAGKARSEPKWKNAVKSYRCNPEQLEAVEKEYDLCVQTNYFGTYCYATAKMTLCDKIEEATCLENSSP